MFILISLPHLNLLQFKVTSELTLNIVLFSLLVDEVGSSAQHPRNTEEYDH